MESFRGRRGCADFLSAGDQEDPVIKQHKKVEAREEGIKNIVPVQD